MATWFLSFVERPSGKNLGVCIVDAPTFEESMTEAWARGCNPGGEVQGNEIAPDCIDVQELGKNRLVTPEQLFRKGYVRHKDRGQH